MSTKILLRWALTITTILCAWGTAALADPPSRVGRLSYVEGALSFHAANQDTWSQAPLNYPITTGDAFWTQDNARSEIQIGSIEMYMDHATELDIVQLEVMPGETAIITTNPPGFNLQEGNATPFDDWALTREKREIASQSVRYVSPHMTGYEDLDRYGQWANDPAYGAVWYPISVQPEWAPYRYGHWAFVQPWGWTWVDDAPWGFAPFHYGRWVQAGPRWGWSPGMLVERPVYAPALVAFVSGAGFSAGNSGPAVGWVPLAPREAFHPYYPTSVNYTRNVNSASVDKTVINHMTVSNMRTVAAYANRQSATVVPAAAFARGMSVHDAVVRVPQSQLSQASTMPAMTRLTLATIVRAGGNAVPPAAGTVAVQHKTPHAPPPIAYNAPAARPALTPQREASAAPPVHHAAPPAITPRPELRVVAAPVVHASAPHPEQKTHMTPTPQGWQRMPQAHTGRPEERPHEAPKGAEKSAGHEKEDRRE